MMLMMEDVTCEACDRTKNTYGSMILSLLNLQCRLIKLHCEVTLEYWCLNQLTVHEVPINLLVLSVSLLSKLVKLVHVPYGNPPKLIFEIKLWADACNNAYY